MGKQGVTPHFPKLSQACATYVVVSPTRNEGGNLPNTIDSVVSQSWRPSVWVIVNDGSTDGTSEIINSAARAHPWIRTVQRPDRGFRKPGGGVIEAFNEGLKLVAGDDWDFLVKLDCDLSFGSRYFESILGRLLAEPKLGIASGVYMELMCGGSWREIAMPSYHAAGACKVLRRKCWEDIGGFIAERGWDTVDEIRAIARGWRTGHFEDLKMKHWKAEGAGVGPFRTSLMHGEIFYRTGGSTPFFILKAIRRAGSRPILLGSACMCFGYLKNTIRGTSRLVTKQEARAYNSLLYGRIIERARALVRRA